MMGGSVDTQRLAVKEALARAARAEKERNDYAHAFAGLQDYVVNALTPKLDATVSRLREAEFNLGVQVPELREQAEKAESKLAELLVAVAEHRRSGVFTSTKELDEAIQNRDRALYSVADTLTTEDDE